VLSLCFDMKKLRYLLIMRTCCENILIVKMIPMEFIILTGQQFCFIVLLQLPLYFVAKDYNQNRSIIYLLSAIITTCYAFPEFYKIFLNGNKEHIFWNLTSFERMNVTDDVYTGQFLVCWSLAYECFQMITDIFYPHLTKDVYVHHVFSISGSYITLSKSLGLYYCFFWTGFANLSSIFLALRDRNLKVPGYMFVPIDICFVISFFIARIFLNSLVSYYYFTDVYSVFNENKLSSMLGIQAFLCYGLCVLQSYWGYLVLTGAIRKFCGKSRNNLKKLKKG
jgi:hypothetical protein